MEQIKAFHLKKGILLLSVFLLFSGCGKGQEGTTVTESRLIVGCTFTEEGILYNNPNPPFRGKAEYLDYQTGAYMPLCDKVNCLHDNKECFAVYLGKASNIGRIGDKWYYLMFSFEEEMPGFYSCDLNGQNERKIGNFEHSGLRTCLFFDDSCVTATRTPLLDAESGEWDADHSVSAVYQYHFDTGEEELLWPEIEDGYYEIYGKYGDQLVCRKIKKEGYGILEVLDLETGELTRPLGDAKTQGPVSMNGNFFVCKLLEEGSLRAVELDLKSGEWSETAPELAEASAFFWSPELKTGTIYEAGNRYKTYQYLEDGTCKLIREEDDSTYRNVFVVRDELVIGESYSDMEAQFRMAVQKKDDYLAGKNNWTVREY